MEAANLPTFLKFGSAKKSDTCVIFAKIMGGHKTGGRAQLPCPDLKLPLELYIKHSLTHYRLWIFP